MTNKSTTNQKSVHFGGQVFFSEEGGHSSLDQSWWNQDELEASFESDVKQARRWSLKSSSCEKRGMESRLAKDAYQTQALNARYVHSVVHRYKRLAQAAKSIGSPADTLQISIARFSTPYTQENAYKARERASKDQQEAYKIYGPMRESIFAPPKKIIQQRRRRSVAAITHAPLRCISC